MYKPQALKDHGEFDFRLEPLQPLDNVFLTYSGENAEVRLSNGSVVHYHLSCANVSVRYALDSAADIFLSNHDEGSDDVNLHIDVIITTRFNIIYPLFIVPVDYKTAIEKDMADKKPVLTYILLSPPVLYLFAHVFLPLLWLVKTIHELL